MGCPFLFRYAAAALSNIPLLYTECRCLVAAPRLRSATTLCAQGVSCPHPALEFTRVSARPGRPDRRAPQPAAGRAPRFASLTVEGWFGRTRPSMRSPPVGRVNEQFAQLISSSVDPGTHRTQFGTHDFGDLFVGETLDVGKVHGNPELFGQGLHRGLDLGVRQ